MDDPFDLEFKSSAASSCATHEVPAGSVQISPQQLHFYVSFEQEKDATKHKIIIMNTTASAVTVTVMCSHPSLIHALALDKVCVKAHSKVQSKVVQHPSTTRQHLAVLHLCTWAAGHTRVSEHFIPVYINCRPSRETYDKFIRLKTKMYKCLRESVIASNESNKTVSRSEQYGYDFRDHLSGDNREDTDLFVPLHDSSGLTRSESSDLSSFDQKSSILKANVSKKPVSKSHEDVSGSFQKISRLREPSSRLYEDAADELLMHRHGVVVTSSSRPMLSGGVSTGSSSSPSLTNIARRPPPTRLVSRGLPPATASRPFDPSEEPLMTQHAVLADLQGAAARVVSPDQLTAGRAGKKSVIQDRLVDHSSASSAGTATNDIMLCWLVVLAAGSHLLYQWWQGGLQHLLDYQALPEYAQKTLVSLCGFFFCFGYLLGQHLHS